MLEKILIELGPWAWWVIGFTLLILEIILPGVFLLWIGLSAIIVGTIALIIPMSWQTQLVIFAVLAIIAAIIGRNIYARFGTATSDNQNLNERGMQFVGRNYMLDEELKDGEGRIRIGDTFWLVRSKDNLAAGTRVKVTAAEGSLLLVERA